MNSSFLYHAWVFTPLNVPVRNIKVTLLSCMWKQKSRNISAPAALIVSVK